MIQKSTSLKYEPPSEPLRACGWCRQANVQILTREILTPFHKQVVLQLYPNYQEIHNEVFVRIIELPITDKLRDIRQVQPSFFFFITLKPKVETSTLPGGTMDPHHRNAEP